MNKQQALERIAAIEAEAAQLRMILDQPTSLLTKPMPGSRECYWGIKSHLERESTTYAGRANDPEPSSYLHGSIFQSETLADNYAKAIETLLLLRHQPGTVPVRGGQQWVIVTTCELSELKVDDFMGKLKASFISPCFDSPDNALVTIDSVGKERILHMFRTLHHVGE